MYKIIITALLTLTLFGCSRQKENSVNITKDTTVRTEKDTTVKTPKDTTKYLGKSLKLEKIIFHTSGCYGTCPTYHLQIDSSRQVKLFAETVYLEGTNFREHKIDEDKTGYFSGSIGNSVYKKLISQLQICNIDTLTFGGPDCCDRPVKTIIVYYNGKRRYLSAMFPPDIAYDLISLLDDICENTKLIRSVGFNIEK
jgi:hypothetical protein